MKARYSFNLILLSFFLVLQMFVPVRAQETPSIPHKGNNVIIGKMEDVIDSAPKDNKKIDPEQIALNAIEFAKNKDNLPYTIFLSLSAFMGVIVFIISSAFIGFVARMIQFILHIIAVFGTIILSLL
ncbi:MAG: hypothetical protein WCV91_00385 [Candidatus Margulisiibacteriota bacterium]